MKLAEGFLEKAANTVQISSKVSLFRFAHRVLCVAQNQRGSNLLKPSHHAISLSSSRSLTIEQLNDIDD